MAHSTPSAAFTAAAALTFWLPSAAPASAESLTESLTEPVAPSPPALFTLTGDADGDRFGHAVLLIPDLDHDGYADILIGAPEGTWNGIAGGYARVYSGRTREVIRTHGAPVPGAEYGAVVCAAFDVDGDFISDYAVGAPGADLVRVFSGATGDLVVTLTGPSGTRFGSSLAAALANGENVQPVLAVGLPGDGAGGPGAGSVRRYDAITGALLTWDIGAEAGAGLGTAIASDLYSNVLAGAPGSVQGGGSYGRVFDFTSYYRPSIFTYEGGAALSPDGGFGSVVAHASLISCQGVTVQYDYFLVGAPGSGGERGSVTRILPSNAIEPDDVIESSVVGDGFGAAIDDAGAVLDGCTQGLVIAAPWATPTGPATAYVSLFDSFAQDELFRIEAEPAPIGDRFALSSFEDVDSDGRRDLALGLPHLGAGEVRIHSLGLPVQADEFFLGDRLFGTIAAPGDFRELSFDGLKGTKIRLLVSSSTDTVHLKITLVDPSDEPVKSWVVLADAMPEIIKAKLKQSGTYRLRIESDGGETGSWTMLTKANVKDDSAYLSGKMKGTPHETSFLALAGGTASAFFQGPSGVDITDATIELLRPDGTPYPALASALVSGPSGEWIAFDPIALDQTGKYQVVLTGLGAKKKVKYQVSLGAPESRRQILPR